LSHLNVCRIGWGFAKRIHLIEELRAWSKQCTAQRQGIVNERTCVSSHKVLPSDKHCSASPNGVEDVFGKMDHDLRRNPPFVRPQRMKSAQWYSHGEAPMNLNRVIGLIPFPLNERKYKPRYKKAISTIRQRAGTIDRSQKEEPTCRRVVSVPTSILR
jgi:hypothetical protein